MIGPLPPPSQAAPTEGKVSTEADTDSDWEDDDDDDYTSRRINIKIKPIAQVSPSKISASVDELRATVEAWKSMSNINHLLKPNSRRHHQSTVQLNQLKQNGSPAGGSSDGLARLATEPSLPLKAPRTDCNVLPVAFSIQECLNARLVNGAEHYNQVQVSGRVIMALPIDSLGSSREECFEKDLELTFRCSSPSASLKPDSNFLRLPDDVRQNHLHLGSSQKTLLVNMKAVRAYLERQSVINKQSDVKYLLIPNLFEYQLGSQEIHPQSAQLMSSSPPPNPCPCPVHVVSHWLLSGNVIKIRVDLSLVADSFNDNNNGNNSLTAEDIRNLKVSVNVDRQVTSFQSRPEATWDASKSKLSWSLGSFDEFTSKSTKGIINCLARLDIREADGDGSIPFQPGDVDLQFSILNKTVSGVQLTINNGENFRLLKQRSEVRTGVFKVEQPKF